MWGAMAAAVGGCAPGIGDGRGWVQSVAGAACAAGAWVSGASVTTFRHVSPPCRPVLVPARRCANLRFCKRPLPPETAEHKHTTASRTRGTFTSPPKRKCPSSMQSGSADANPASVYLSGRFSDSGGFQTALWIVCLSALFQKPFCVFLKIFFPLSNFLWCFHPGYVVLRLPIDRGQIYCFIL